MACASSTTWCRWVCDCGWCWVTVGGWQSGGRGARGMVGCVWTCRTGVVWAWVVSNWQGGQRVCVGSAPDAVSAAGGKAPFREVARSSTAGVAGMCAVVGLAAAAVPMRVWGALLPPLLPAGLEVLCVLTHQRAFQDPAHPEVSGSSSSVSSCRSAAGSLLQFSRALQSTAGGAGSSLSTGGGAVLSLGREWSVACLVACLW